MAKKPKAPKAEGGFVPFGKKPGGARVPPPFKKGGRKSGNR